MVPRRLLVFSCPVSWFAAFADRRSHDRWPRPLAAPAGTERAAPRRLISCHSSVVCWYVAAKYHRSVVVPTGPGRDHVAGSGPL